MDFSVADVMSIVLSLSMICGLIAFFTTRKKDYQSEGVIRGKTESRLENIDASLISIREQLSILPSISERLVAIEIEQKAMWRRFEEIRVEIDKIRGG